MWSIPSVSSIIKRNLPRKLLGWFDKGNISIPTHSDHIGHVFHYNFLQPTHVFS